MKLKNNPSHIKSWSFLSALLIHILILVWISNDIGKIYEAEEIIVKIINNNQSQKPLRFVGKKTGLIKEINKPRPKLTKASTTQKPDQTVSEPEQEDSVGNSDLESAEEYELTKTAQVAEEIRILYPESARKAGKTGIVKLKILVDKIGRVREIKTLENPDSELTNEAIKAIQKFKFNPAYVESKPVSSWITYSYEFKLQ